MTSHRFIWADTSAFPRQGCSCQLPLSAVHEVQLKASMMLRSPKLRVHVYLDEHSKPAEGTLCWRFTAICYVTRLQIPCHSFPADRKGSVRVEQLKIVASHMTSFLDSLRSALRSRLWERSQPAESSGQSHISSPSAAAASGSSSMTMDKPLVDNQLVSMLVAMGFPKHRAVKAALETGNTGASYPAAYCLERLNSARPMCICDRPMQAGLADQFV